MIIGVVSDTHSKDIPQQLLDDFKKVDLIIHAGDFCSLRDYQIFQRLKEVKAVYGNMDGGDLRAKLQRRQIFECENVTIGVYHGVGAKNRVLDYVKNEFKNDKVNAVIFGHSHNPFNQVIDNVLYFNPGSPNDEICAPYCSYGILEVKQNKIVGKIIKVK